MSTCTQCSVCPNPGTFDTAGDVESVFCNVRQFRKERFTVWRCEGCRSLHSMEDIDLDHYYRNYPIKRQKLDLVVRAAYAKRLKWLKSHGLSKDMSVLDYGCGMGTFVEFLKRKGYANARGYDLYCHEHAVPEMLQSEYDVVVAQDVIEHAEDPSAMMADLKALLKPNGLLAIGTPNAAEIDLDEPEGFLMQLHQPYHRHMLSEKALVGLAGTFGLETVDVCNRFYLDTLWPFLNTRYVLTLARKLGNDVDFFFDDPSPFIVLRFPSILPLALTGYFFPAPGNMVVFLRNRA